MELFEALLDSHLVPRPQPLVLGREQLLGVPRPHQVHIAEGAATELPHQHELRLHGWGGGTVRGTCTV